MATRDPEAERARKRRYYQENRERILAQTKARHEANPERMRAYQKRLREDKATRDKILAAKRAWNAQRGKRVLTETQAEANRQRAKAWREANPERYRELSRRKTANRRARLRAAEGFIALRDWARLVNRHGGLCAYCGERPWTDVDHVIPLARGGRNTIGNVLPACGLCNGAKGAKLLIEWRRKT